MFHTHSVVEIELQLGSRPIMRRKWHPGPPMVPASKYILSATTAHTRRPWPPSRRSDFQLLMRPLSKGLNSRYPHHATSEFSSPPPCPARGSFKWDFERNYQLRWVSLGAVQRRRRGSFCEQVVEYAFLADFDLGEGRTERAVALPAVE